MEIEELKDDDSLMNSDDDNSVSQSDCDLIIDFEIKQQKSTKAKGKKEASRAKRTPSV